VEIGYNASAPKHNSKIKAREFMALALKPQTTTPQEPSEKEIYNEIEKITSHKSKDEQLKAWNIDLIMNIGEFEYDINTDASKTIDIATNKTYKKSEIAQLLGDLRHWIGFVEDKWYFKVLRFKKGGSQAIVREYDEKQLRAHYKNYRPFKSKRTITLVDIIVRQSHRFQYQRGELYAPLSQPPKTINLFQQFAFTEIITDDFTIIQPFLNHINQTICNDDKAKYDYFMGLVGLFDSKA
jgi:hypothetical protein